MKTDAATLVGSSIGNGVGPVCFACPECKALLEHAGEDTLWCPSHQHAFQRMDGVWRMMFDDRLTYFRSFVNDYETVRSAEGRGADDASYYRNLPFKDLTGKFSEDWRIRATSFQALLDRVIVPLERRLGKPATILDLGAGNGWLSNQLAGRGHTVIAVDLLTNPIDGLGAHTHYETAFIPVQAEFNRLPVADNQADLAVFNGSLHYSTDILKTLAEALRVLKPAGRLAIIDTPVYRDARSGREMVREREEDFQQRYGLRSNAIPSENFLTYDRLEMLALSLPIRWQIHEPDYGLQWKLKPWKARLKRRREPARFLLISGIRGHVAAEPARKLRTAIARRVLRYRYRLTQRSRYDRLVLENVAGYPIVVLPQVFNPKLLRSGEFLAETLIVLDLPAHATVLDMGTGSGIGAVVAASNATSVVAVDINPAAVRCARINALLNQVDDRVTVHEGDLFEPVQGNRFDVVLFNPPYYRGQPVDALDAAWRSVDVVERFSSGLTCHLTANGFALIVLSTDGESETFLNLFGEHGFLIEIAARKQLSNETLTVYKVSLKGA